MTCQDCAQAQAAKHWGGYHADCHGCQVRSLASGPAYFSALQAFDPDTVHGFNDVKRGRLLSSMKSLFSSLQPR